MIGNSELKEIQFYTVIERKSLAFKINGIDNMSQSRVLLELITLKATSSSGLNYVESS